MAQLSVAVAYFLLLPGFPEDLVAIFFGGALGAGFFADGFAGAFAGALPAGLPLGAALGGGAV